MNAIELLKADHARVQALFRQYEAAGHQPQQQRELAEQLFMALEVHASLEEELFYPAVRAQLGTVTVEEEPAEEADEDEEVDLVVEALEEHQEVKTLIATLRGLKPGDAQFQAAFTELREGVEEHVGMEEDELIPAVAAALGRELERLASSWRSAGGSSWPARPKRSRSAHHGGGATREAVTRAVGQRRGRSSNARHWAAHVRPSPSPQASDTRAIREVCTIYCPHPERGRVLVDQHAGRRRVEIADDRYLQSVAGQDAFDIGPQIFDADARQRFPANR